MGQILQTSNAICQRLSNTIGNLGRDKQTKQHCQHNQANYNNQANQGATVNFRAGFIALLHFKLHQCGNVFIHSFINRQQLISQSLLLITNRLNISYAKCAFQQVLSDGLITTPGSFGISKSSLAGVRNQTAFNLSHILINRGNQFSCFVGSFLFSVSIKITNSIMHSAIQLSQAAQHHTDIPLGKTELLQGVVVLFLNTAHHKSANNAGDACQNGNTDNRNRNFVFYF